MRIDIIFDTICPWCFIGKRRLELLLEKKQYLNLEINWHPYFLNTGMPPEGMHYEEYMREKYGANLDIEKLHYAINQTAKSLDLRLNFTKIKWIPNSLESHRMIKLANRQNQGDEMLEALYQNYFVTGKNIGNRSVLIDIATNLGYDRSQVRAYLYSDRDILEIFKQNQSSLSIGTNGIPAFIFNEKFSISGAQDEKILLRLLNISENNLNKYVDHSLQNNFSDTSNTIEGNEKK